MAIKFQTNNDQQKASETTKARFATPMDATEPVNPDAASELPFGKAPKGEKKARKAVKR